MSGVTTRRAKGASAQTASTHVTATRRGPFAPRTTRAPAPEETSIESALAGHQSRLPPRGLIDRDLRAGEVDAHLQSPLAGLSRGATGHEHARQIALPQLVRAGREVLREVHGLVGGA